MVDLGVSLFPGSTARSDPAERNGLVDCEDDSVNYYRTVLLQVPANTARQRLIEVANAWKAAGLVVRVEFSSSSPLVQGEDQALHVSVSAQLVDFQPNLHIEASGTCHG